MQNFQKERVEIFKGLLGLWIVKSLWDPINIFFVSVCGKRECKIVKGEKKEKRMNVAFFMGCGNVNTDQVGLGRRVKNLWFMVLILCLSVERENVTLWLWKEKKEKNMKKLLCGKIYYKVEVWILWKNLFEFTIFWIESQWTLIPY